MNIVKKYKTWVLPTKISIWASLFTLISTPAAIITYLQFFGNDDIANKLYKVLQANVRPYVKIKNANILTYMNEGKVLVLNIENLSKFPAKNIKTKIIVSKNTEFVGSFNNSILLRKDLIIPAKTISQIAVLTLKQLNDYIHKEYPEYNVVDIKLLDKQSKYNGLGYPFYVILSYKTDGNEDINQSVALNAILN